MLRITFHWRALLFLISFACSTPIAEAPERNPSKFTTAKVGPAFKWLVPLNRSELADVRQHCHDKEHAPPAHVPQHHVVPMGDGTYAMSNFTPQRSHSASYTLNER